MQDKSFDHEERLRALTAKVISLNSCEYNMCLSFRNFCKLGHVSATVYVHRCGCRHVFYRA
jgi:hypothetical protein